MKFFYRERRHTADPLDRRAYKGGSKKTTTGPKTTNNDNRMALDDSLVMGAGAKARNINVTTYAADAQVLQTLADDMPDAVKAMMNAGADVINRAGGAVVNLNKDSMAANTMSFDRVVDFGSSAIDKLIDASVKTSQIGNDLATTAVKSYQPDAKNDADSTKYLMYAAAGVVALVLLGKKA